MKLEEAQEKLEQEQQDFTLKYCPVFKELCKGVQCHAYYKGSVSKNNNNEFNSFPPLCSSPLVTGEMITTEG